MQFNFIPSHTTNPSTHSQENMQSHLNSNDEVINKTKWTPLIGGGKSFKSHKLIIINKDRLQFRISFEAASFCLYMLVFGLFLMFISVFGESLGFSVSGSPLAGFLVGLLFAGLGVFLFLRASKRITIDKNIPAIWKGKVDPTKLINTRGIDSYTSLKKLHAIQVIKEYIHITSSQDEDGFSKKNNSYDSYEINLVFDNGKRINVVDHGHFKTICEHSSTLAQFLNVPLWNACTSSKNNFESKISSLTARGFQLYGWGKVAIIIGISAVFLWGFYANYLENQKEKSTNQALSQEEKLEKNTDYTAKLFSLVKNNPDSYYMRQAVERGANVNAKDEHGQTPAHYAALLKNNSTLWTLIKMYADVRIKNNEGKTPRDLLPKIQSVHDFHLHHLLEDAELTAKARSEGKTVLRIERRYNKKGDKVTAVNVIYE